MANKVSIEHVDLLNEDVVIVELSDGRTLQLTLGQILKATRKLDVSEESDSN